MGEHPGHVADRVPAGAAQPHDHPLLAEARFKTRRRLARVAQQDLEALLYQVPNVLDIDPVAASHHVNERPVTVYGKLVWPKKATLEAVARL